MSHESGILLERESKSLNTQTLFKLPHSEIEEIIFKSDNFLSLIQNSHILIAGGTGFIGKWLVSTLAEANKTYKLNIKISIITRDITTAKRLFADALTGINLVEGDLTASLEIPPQKFDYIFHGGVSSSSLTGNYSSEQMYNLIVNGTNQLIEFSKKLNSPPTFIHLSSGAAKNFEDTALSANSMSEMQKAYGFGKIKAEQMVQEATDNGILKGVNLRLFAFAGPYVPLDQHFAVGNFMNNALKGQPILITGNPDTQRSYLYPTDMITWIFRAAYSRVGKITDIGSYNILTVRQIAKAISIIAGGLEVDIKDNHALKSAYFPNELSTEKFTDAIQYVSFDETLNRWWKWLKRDENLGLN